MSSILSLEYSEHELKFALDNKLHGNFKTALRFFDAKLAPNSSSPPSLPRPPSSQLSPPSSQTSSLFPDETDPSIRGHLLAYLEAEKESCLVHLSQWDRLKTPPFTSNKRQDLIYSFTEQFSNRGKRQILQQKLMELWRREGGNGRREGRMGREGGFGWQEGGGGWEEKGGVEEERGRKEEDEGVWDEFHAELAVNWLMGDREDVEKAKFFLAVDKRKLLTKFAGINNFIISVSIVIYRLVEFCTAG